MFPGRVLEPEPMYENKLLNIPPLGEVGAVGRGDLVGPVLPRVGDAGDVGDVGADWWPGWEISWYLTNI